MNTFKSNLLLQLICSMFIFLFVYTAVSKFQEFKGFSLALSKFPLIGNKSTIIAWAVPITELSIAMIVFVPKIRLIGLYASFFLMGIFTAYIGYMVAFTPHLPCLCGGVIRQMNWPQHLFFNVFFSLLALLGIKMQKKIYTDITGHEKF